RLVRADRNALDIGCRETLRCELLVQRDGSFDGGLRVELGRERDFEEHVLHLVAAVGPLEFEFLASETDVIEAPRLCGEHAGVAHLARLRNEREANRARGRIARSPTLARTRVRGMAIRAQRLTIDPGERDS